MSYPMAVVIAISIICFMTICLKLIEEFFQWKRSDWYNEYKLLKEEKKNGGKS